MNTDQAKAVVIKSLPPFRFCDVIRVKPGCISVAVGFPFGTKPDTIEQQFTKTRDALREAIPENVDIAFTAFVEFWP